MSLSFLGVFNKYICQKGLCLQYLSEYKKLSGLVLMLIYHKRQLPWVALILQSSVCLSVYLSLFSSCWCLVTPTVALWFQDVKGKRKELLKKMLKAVLEWTLSLVQTLTEAPARSLRPIWKGRKEPDPRLHGSSWSGRTLPLPSMQPCSNSQGSVPNDRQQILHTKHPLRIETSSTEDIQVLE